MDVSDVLRDRLPEPAGLQRMVVVSAFVHAALVALAILAPGAWLGKTSESPRTVMNISLGGAPGPNNGGMNQEAAKAVQEQTPPDAPKSAPILPPAAKTPEMVLPKPGAVPLKRPNTAPVAQAPDQATGRKPSQGAQPTPGTSLAGPRGTGFYNGLSTGGGHGLGSSVDVEGDFCCPGYLAEMNQKIQENWNDKAESTGEAVIKFTIQRDGTLTDVSLEKSSGYSALDREARRALSASRQLLPLPREYPNPTLTVHVHFQYVQ
jgi:protein TonB